MIKTSLTLYPCAKVVDKIEILIDDMGRITLKQKENIVDIDFETLRLFLDFIYETNDE